MNQNSVRDNPSPKNVLVTVSEYFGLPPGDVLKLAFGAILLAALSIEREPFYPRPSPAFQKTVAISFQYEREKE